MLPYTGPVSMISAHARRPSMPFIPVKKSLGSKSPAMGQTFDEMLNFSPAIGDVIRLVAHGTATWLGIYVGTSQRGFVSVAGWGLGVLNGIGAVLDVASLAKRALGVHPPESTMP